jgi:glycosyltransferase involved in cell wall biosynthesis
MISVVVPLYNKGAYVTATLNSVLSQSYFPGEIIVVDDGSTDNGPEVVLQYEHQGVRLIRQVNQGVSAARNKGLDEAASEYVAFLDADDLWNSNHLEQLAVLIKRFPEAALLSTAHQVFSDGVFYVPRSFYESGWSGIVDDFFAAYSVGFSLVNSSAACVRKSALKTVGGFKVGESRGEDIVAWVRLALSYPVAHVNLITVVYNKDAANRTSQLRAHKVPYSLRYLAGLLRATSMRRKSQKSLRVFFNHLAFFTAAGFCLEHDKDVVKKIAVLAWGVDHYYLALVVFLLRFIPADLLRMARRHRHSRAGVTGRLMGLLKASAN